MTAGGSIAGVEHSTIVGRERRGQPGPRSRTRGEERTARPRRAHSCWRYLARGSPDVGRAHRRGDRGPPHTRRDRVYPRAVPRLTSPRRREGRRARHGDRRIRLRAPHGDARARAQLLDQNVPPKPAHEAWPGRGMRGAHAIRAPHWRDEGVGSAARRQGSRAELRTAPAGAEAEMRATTERVMVRIRPRDIEAIRLPVDARIAIRGAERREHRPAVGRKNSIHRPFLLPGRVKDSRRVEDGRGVSMIRWAGRTIAAWAKPRADLIVENLCLRQQLIVLQRRVPRPRLRDADRRFWISSVDGSPNGATRSSSSNRKTVLRWASPGMDGLLAVAVPATKEGRSASPAAGPAGLDPAYVRRESPLGTTTCPGRARAARIPGVGPDRRQVHAEAVPSILSIQVP
jgi:hypothetical protein